MRVLLAQFFSSDKTRWHLVCTAITCTQWYQRNMFFSSLLEGTEVLLGLSQSLPSKPFWVELSWRGGPTACFWLQGHKYSSPIHMAVNTKQGRLSLSEEVPGDLWRGRAYNHMEGCNCSASWWTHSALLSETWQPVSMATAQCRDGGKGGRGATSRELLKFHCVKSAVPFFIIIEQIKSDYNAKLNSKFSNKKNSTSPSSNCFCICICIEV